MRVCILSRPWFLTSQLKRWRECYNIAGTRVSPSTGSMCKNLMMRSTRTIFFEIWSALCSSNLAEATLPACNPMYQREDLQLATPAHVPLNSVDQTLRGYVFLWQSHLQSLPGCPQRLQQNDIQLLKPLSGRDSPRYVRRTSFLHI